MVIAGGLVLLAAFCIVGRAVRERFGLIRAAKIYIPFWAVLSVVNMTIGVVSAGYTVMEELPILVIVFGIPAGIAMLIPKFAKTDLRRSIEKR